MKNLRKKKGFTLIELMIVLAIIAILAVVLIPKAGVFKNQAKNSGVLTNVNTVRAFLETKTGDSFIATNTDLQAALNAAFNPTGGSDGEIMKNPVSDSSSVVLTSAIPGSAVKPSIAIIAGGSPTLTADYAGSVVVEIGTKEYTVYGLDNGGISKATKTFKVK
jgi:type IV pilus assembly protein PilA